MKESKFQNTRCQSYAACVNGVYNPITFKYEGALSQTEHRAYNEIVAADGPCKIEGRE